MAVPLLFCCISGSLGVLPLSVVISCSRVAHSAVGLFLRPWSSRGLGPHIPSETLEEAFQLLLGGALYRVADGLTYMWSLRAHWHQWQGELIK
jgi:hypothetical protein